VAFAGERTFSRAIIVFLILMTGRHPFDAKGMDNYQEGLAKGSFAYRPAGELPTGLIPDGMWIFSGVLRSSPAGIPAAICRAWSGHGQNNEVVSAVAVDAEFILGEGLVVRNLADMEGKLYSAHGSCRTAGGGFPSGRRLPAESPAPVLPCGRGGKASAPSRRSGGKLDSQE
jgi:hypothetical protein